MNTSTGDIYLNEEEAKKALKKKQAKPENLVQLPVNIAQQLINKNRKERRAWWAQNRHKLNLPSWSQR